eukprot:sb/3462683/
MKARKPSYLPPTDGVTDSFVTVIVGGERFKTRKSTLEYFPDSLLGGPGTAAEYWEEDRAAYVFPTRCRMSFENILYFYQTEGYVLKCPESVHMATFKEECLFFKLPEDDIARCEHGEVLDMVKRMESEPKNEGTLNKIGKKIMAPGSLTKKVLGVIDMIATVVYILILITMTEYVIFRSENDLTQVILTYLSASCVGWFIIHYLVMLLSTTDKKGHCLGLLSLIDFLVVSSFLMDFFSQYMFEDQTLRKKVTEARILIGVARQLCIARYSTLLYCLGVAVCSGKDLLHILYLLIILILVFSSAAYFFETDSGLHIDNKERMWREIDKAIVDMKVGEETLFSDLQYVARNGTQWAHTRYIEETSAAAIFKSYINGTSLMRLDPSRWLSIDQYTEKNGRPDKNSFVSKVIYTRFIEKVNLTLRFRPVIRNGSMIIIMVENFIPIWVGNWGIIIEIESMFTSIPASLWWGFVTITTVGYGDLAPRTAWGKVISAVLALTGIPLIAIPLPLIMNEFTNQYQETKRREELERQAGRLYKQRAAERSRVASREPDYSSQNDEECEDRRKRLLSVVRLFQSEVFRRGSLFKDESIVKEESESEVVGEEVGSGTHESGGEGEKQESDIHTEEDIGSFEGAGVGERVGDDIPALVAALRAAGVGVNASPNERGQTADGTQSDQQLDIPYS